MLTAQTDAASPRSARGFALAAAGAALLLTGALWLRFGESVYARSLIDGFIACF